MISLEPRDCVPNYDDKENTILRVFRKSLNMIRFEEIETT